MRVTDNSLALSEVAVLAQSKSIISGIAVWDIYGLKEDDAYSDYVSFFDYENFRSVLIEGKDQCIIQKCFKLYK